MRKLFLVLLLASALLLAGCTGGKNDQSVQGQLKGNQALLLNLQNAADLNHLYFYYSGQGTDAPPPGSVPSTTRPRGLDYIGELNMLLHNVGGSATAGGLYVVGYDPNLIVVRSKLGQPPIRYGNSRSCYHHIGVAETGRYDVTVFCDSQEQNGVSFGGRVSDSGDGTPDILGTIRNLPLDRWADWVASQITRDNVDFFTNAGIFSQNRIDCGVRDGRFGCNIQFGNPAFDPNRATYGYILVNLLFGAISDCPNNCRVFPDSFMTGQVLHGISDDYPQGEALFYDYEIYINKSAWNPLLNDLRQTFQVTACYIYTTVATPSVCVDPDPTTNRNEPCTTTPVIFDDSQGAPIKVARIDQSPRPGSIAYTIYIEHIGNGEVWLPAGFDQCSPYSPVRPDKRLMDAVVLLDARISGDFQQLQCLGQSWDPTDSDNPAKRRVVRLENGKGKITCLYPVNDVTVGRSAYLSALTLEFGYVYRNTVQKDVVIHRT